MPLILRPPAVVRGRSLNPHGTPAAGVTVSAVYPDGITVVFQEAHQPDGWVRTGKGGEFRFDHMIPGIAFSLLHSAPSKEGRFLAPTGHLANGREFGPVKAGETSDLGDITLGVANQRSGE